MESVPATTLERELLDSGLKQLDLMILDLEGMELDALRGLGEHRPRIVIIETRAEDALPLSDSFLIVNFVCMAICQNSTSLVNLSRPETIRTLVGARTRTLKQFKSWQNYKARFLVTASKVETKERSL